MALAPGDLYGGVLFHQGRFRRLGGYRTLRATECLADISPDGSTVWFGRYLPARLVLGDPGARDAAIHGIQACIPHATLLPIGVERMVSRGLASDVPLLLAARERSRNGDEFVYDLELVTAGGELRERWEGLRLRAVDRIAPPRGLDGRPARPLRRAAAPGAPPRLPGAGVAGGRRRRGAPPPAGRRARRDPRRASRVSHAGDLVLSVTGDGRIGCDLEPVAGRSAEIWRGLLGAERSRLAELIARERGESLDAAATRVWAAAESLVKAGAPQGAPLTLETGGDGGWLLLRSGELRIGTFVAPVRELAGPAALAILVETSH